MTRTQHRGRLDRQKRPHGRRAEMYLGRDSLSGSLKSTTCKERPRLSCVRASRIAIASAIAEVFFARSSSKPHVASIERKAMKNSPWYIHHEYWNMRPKSIESCASARNRRAHMTASWFDRRVNKYESRY